MSDEDVVATFMAITGCSEDVAVSYLAEGGFDLGTAQSLYMADQREQEMLPPIGVSSASETSNMGSPGYTTPPYLVTRLDGGGRQDEFPAVPNSRPAPLHARQQPPQSFGESDMNSELFATPSFVEEGVMPFSEFCLRSVGSDQWVVLSLLGDDFKSFCVNRDIWCSEFVRDVLNMFSIYQVSATTERGLELANGYRLDHTRDLPTLLIINPLTTMRELSVPLNFSGTTVDANEVNEALLTFVGERGSPLQWDEKKRRMSHDNVPSTGTLNEPILIGDTEGEIPLVTASQPERVEVLPPSAPPAPTVVVVDIGPYEAAPNDKNAFALRCRLPKGQLTLMLKPETPAYLLVDYLAYRAYQDHPAAYPLGVPRCSLKTGYPAKELTVENKEVQLVTWGAVRSGDTVFLHLC